MSRRLSLVVAAVVLLPGLALAVPRPLPPRLHPSAVSPLPSYIRKVEPSVVALAVTAPAEAPSSTRLGAQRAGSGVIFDDRGYVVTVSYLVLDALRIEARTRDGAVVNARLVGVDLDTGLAVVRLDAHGPWPAAPLGDSRDVAAGAIAGLVGADEDNDLVHAAAHVDGVRRFSAFWEYMLPRAFIVSPAIASWGGSAMVDERGQLVGIVSLRLGEEPSYVNMAIPLETFLPVKDELIATGRIESRRPRPWIGLNTRASADGVFVDGFNESGPARLAGFVKGDRIIGVNGVKVHTQEEFYEQMWRRRAGDTIEVVVRRAQAVRTIPVRSIDRTTLYRTSQ
ncbi:MAG TPA: S1C family serine protease [Methylomirabilota bacterium]|jgi:S1-C subfamily serine protease|nr:S1C family serine protease [Methylomirabilota bacterium]